MLNEIISIVTLILIVYKDIADFLKNKKQNKKNMEALLREIEYNIMSGVGNLKVPFKTTSHEKFLEQDHSDKIKKQIEEIILKAPLAMSNSSGYKPGDIKGLEQELKTNL